MKNKIFNTRLGWSGVAVSDHGICRIVLPKKSRKAVERELRSGKRGDLRPALTSLAPSGYERYAANAGGANARVQGVRSAGKVSGRTAEVLNKSVLLLEKYFSGERVVFDLPLDFRYYTPFQQSAWKACADIPFGKTRSYLWVARRIGKPLAARAVGQAMGANPIPIVIP